MRKVLIISNDLEIGGIQKSLVDFLNYISKKELEIDLLLWQTDGILKEDISKSVNIIGKKYSKTWNDIKNEKNPVTKIQSVFDYLKFNFYSKILKKPWLYFSEIKKNYDFAISYNQNGFPLFYAIDRVKAKSKFLFYHHGSYESKGKKYNLEKKYYAKFKEIITVSNANKKMLMNYFPELEHKISVIPNIINIEKIISDSKEVVVDFDKQQGIINFVTVSRFSKEKGLHLAIDIAEELRNQGLKFRWYFIGDGELFLQIGKLITERNLDDFCILLGTKENPYPYMKLADFYIQTSLVESQSITILEALVLKKIIITTNLPALNYALQNGKVGILCEPEKSSFVDQIMSLAVDFPTQNKLVQNVEEHVVKNDLAFNEIDKLFEI